MFKSYFLNWANFKNYVSIYFSKFLITSNWEHKPKNMLKEFWLKRNSDACKACAIKQTLLLHIRSYNSISDAFKKPGQNEETQVMKFFSATLFKFVGACSLYSVEQHDVVFLYTEILWIWNR